MVSRSLIANMLQYNRVVGCPVALVSWICWRLETDESIVTLEHKSRLIDYGYQEPFLVRDLIADSIQTSVHSCCQVFAIRCLDGRRSIGQPLYAEQTFSAPKR